MSAPGQPLLGLLQLVPDAAPLTALRDALLAASHEDEARRWARSRTYATLDARTLEPEAIGRLVGQVSARERERAERSLRAVGTALEQRATGDLDGALRTLLELGERQLGEGEHGAAAATFEAVLRNAAAGEDRRLEGLALRGLAKACWRRGELERAYDLYARTRQIAREQGDRTLEIVSAQGLGNVRAAQGRLAEAAALHEEGLALCGPDDRLLRGQLANNLSQVARRQGELERAADWQAMAEDIWRTEDAPADRLIALNNRGLLHLAAGELDDARTSFLRALEQSRAALPRAALLVNLAHTEVRQGALEHAEGLARDAEQGALLCGATDLLMEAYTVLGVVHRERRDDLGVTFFEKAIELGADGRYPLELARVHVEYGRLRQRTGDAAEAAAHFARARGIFERLGARPDLEELARTVGP